MSGVVLSPYANAFLEYAAARPDVVCLSGDLTASCEVAAFRDAHPERFFNVGMAEQNMLGIAGGMARGGLVPFVHTFGVFATRRPFDQLAMAIGVPRRKVRIMGFLPGLSTPGGVTHQAIDDVALTRAVPGMTVVDLADATEIQTVLPQLDAIDGPVYCRVLRGSVPVLFDTPFELGRARVLARGHELCLISASVTTAEAMRAARMLADAGVSVAHLHVSTVKPLDRDAVLEAVAGARAAIVVENHLTTGGLGSAVAETLAEAGVARPLVRLGLQDTYGGGGSQPYLLRRFAMDADAILDRARTLLGLEHLDAAGAAAAVAAGDLTRQEAL